MASIINADTSDGLKITSDTSGQIDLQSAGSTKATIDTSGNLKFDSGYGSVATAYGCRAWVNFNGSGTVAIRDSANVSSITDSGVGKWIINFATAMPDGNYTVVGTQNYNQNGADNHTNVVTHIRRVATPLTTTQAYVATSYNQNAHDATMACFVVFR
jgi:hypothetical protein